MKLVLCPRKYSLGQSVYPVYFAFLDYREQSIGFFLSFRALGPVIVGLASGSFIAISRQRGIYALGMAGLGLAVIASGLTTESFLLAAAMVGLGAGGGIMDLLYQVQATEFSKAGDRTVAMASAGLGWILCPLIAPMAVGWLAQTYGFQLAFLAGGLFFLLIAAGTRVWHRLLLA